MSLDWKGDEVQKKMESCIKQAINQTMSRASIHAKNNHPWVNRTGTLEGSIRPVERARKKGDEFIGVWGSVDVNYALPLELGFSVNSVVGVPAFGKTKKAWPYLRPAADAEYPKLASRIAKLYDRKIVGPILADLEGGF